jgi:hypothetical protein
MFDFTYGQRSASGRGAESGPDGTEYEDFFVCFHCQYTTFVQPKEDPANLGGLCKICMKLICAKCVAKNTCTPWEKRMEKMEARQRFLNSAGLG